MSEREFGACRAPSNALSFYERMWLHGWFAGAAMVTPENSLATFFEKPAAP